MRHIGPLTAGLDGIPGRFEPERVRADLRTPAALLLLLVGCLGEIVSADDIDATSAGGDGSSPPIDARSPNDGQALVDAAHGLGEPTALAGITLAHNQVRSEVGVDPLVWDPALAAIAQAWADSCVDNESPAGLIDHNPDRSTDYEGYVGENIYGSLGTASPDSAVAAWAAEAASYDYDTNTCSAVCGHYTQVVWSTTERLGCGISSCPSLTYGSSIVCNYSPGGNTGGRPY